MKQHLFHRLWSLALCSLLLFALLGSAPHAAHAGVIRYAAPTTQGSGDCSSWANACTLQTALTGAANGDEIWVKMGTHLPGASATATFALKNGVAVYGGFAGTETARTQRNWQANVTTLHGEYSAPNRVRHVVTTNGTDATAILDGFTISKGQAGLSGTYAQGGGVLNVNGTPTLRNLVLQNNYAYNCGGGLYSSNSNLTLTNVTFQNNSSQQSGGGMCSNMSNITLQDVQFLTNTSIESGEGGGLYIAGETNTHTLTNVIFSNNTAYRYQGAGLYVGGGKATLTNVVFDRNRFTSTFFDSYGGGMYLLAAKVEMINVTFVGNQANTSGGGWYAINNGPSYPSVITMTNSILWNNTATSNPQYGLESSSSATITYSDVEQSSGVHPGAGNINSNPQFVDAVNGNLRLQLASPCIDAGNNAAVPAGITTDLDGRARFVDIPAVPDTGAGTAPIVDMGGYEAFLYADVTIRKAVTPASAAPGAPITFTLTLTNLGTTAATTVIVTDTVPWLTGASYASNLSLSPVAGKPAYVWNVSPVAPGQSGIITITGLLQSPLAAGTQTNTAYITAANDAYPQNNSGAVNFTVLNVPPVFTSTPITVALQNALYTYTITTTDANGNNTLQFVTPTKPTWLTFTDEGNGTATLSGTPSVADTHTIRLRVSDGVHEVYQDFTITVKETRQIFLPLVLRQ